MAWIGGPDGGGMWRKPIVLRDPPPGYHPPRMQQKVTPRQLRRAYILMRVATVVLILLAVAFLVIIGVMIATYA
jgi:hypothetical protein